MRVLQVISSLGTGGAERFVTQLVPALRILGVEAQLLVLDRERSNFHDELEACGVHDSISLNMARHHNPWSIVKLVPHLRGYDVIHTHLFPTQYWVAAAAALSAPHTPLVTTEHNTRNRRRNLRGFQWLDRQVYRRYRAVVSVSTDTQNQLNGYLDADSTCLLTITNGIDLVRFDHVIPASLQGLPGYSRGDRYIVQVASFTAQKDHATLIRALAACPPHMKLLLAGEGPLLDPMRALASQLGLRERVHFLGVRNDIPGLLKAADLAVMSSHHEGLSLSVLEAFAAGTPFIGTDAPGLGTMAARGGLTVPPVDAQALASVMTRLAGDATERATLAERGLSVAREHAIVRCAEQHRDLYERLRQRLAPRGVAAHQLAGNEDEG